MLKLWKIKTCFLQKMVQKEYSWFYSSCSILSFSNSHLFISNLEISLQTYALLGVISWVRGVCRVINWRGGQDGGVDQHLLWIILQGNNTLTALFLFCIVILYYISIYRVHSVFFTDTPACLLWILCIALLSVLSFLYSPFCTRWSTVRQSTWPPASSSPGRSRCKLGVGWVWYGLVWLGLVK